MRNHIQRKKNHLVKESCLKDQVKYEFQIMKYGISKYIFLKFLLAKSKQTELEKKVKTFEKDLALHNNFEQYSR